MNHRIAKKRVKMLGAVFLLCAPLATGLADQQAPSPDATSFAQRLHFVPHNAVLAWSWKEPPANPKPSSSDSKQGLFSVTQGLTQIAQQAGLLDGVDPAVKLGFNGIASISTLFEYAGTMVVMPAADLSATNAQLARLRAGLIVQGKGDFSKLEMALRYLIANHTDQNHGTITTIQDKGQPYYVLEDNRLPEGLSICWGPVASHYVLALGQETFKTLSARVREESDGLPKQAWATLARSNPNLDARHVVMADLNAMRTCSRSLSHHLKYFSKVWNSDSVDRVLLQLSWDQPSLEIAATLESRGHARKIRIAGIDTAEGESTKGKDAWHGGMIPEQASSYAVMHLKPELIMDAVTLVHQMLQHPDSRANSTRYWQGLREKAAFEPQRDLYPALQSKFILHDVPQHALQIPMAMTIVIPLRNADHASNRTGTELDNGNAKPLATKRQIEQHLGRLLTVLQEEWREGGSLVQLDQTSDDIWFLHMGLRGPGLKVVDQAIVLSFSPEAVRMACDAMSTSSN
ncbi:MAG: hypothetical protein ACPGXK_02880 [Phycisphaerae bacterium]